MTLENWAEPWSGAWASGIDRVHGAARQVSWVLDTVCTVAACKLLNLFPCYCCQARLSPDLPDLCLDPPAPVYSLQPADSSKPSTAPRRTTPHAYHSRAPATTQSGPTTAHPPIHQLPTHLSFLPLFSHILTSTLPDNNNSTPRPHTPGTVNAVRPPPLSLSLALVEVEAAGPSPVPHPLLRPSHCSSSSDPSSTHSCNDYPKSS